MGGRWYDLGVNIHRTCKNCGAPFEVVAKAGNPQVHCTPRCRVQYQIRQRALRPRQKAQSLRRVVGRYETSAGYVKVLRPGHPLADKQGHVYEHRLVAYDRLAGAMPACFWCGASLKWAETVVDHLNENKADNAPPNLVCSCNDCNRARGALVPFVRRMRADAIETFVRAMHLMRA